MPPGQISEAKRVGGLPELLQEEELKEGKRFHKEKEPELSEEFGGVFRFWLAQMPMAAEDPEVDLRPMSALPGLLSYCKMSTVCVKFLIQNHDLHSPQS